MRTKFLKALIDWRFPDVIATAAAQRSAEGNSAKPCSRPVLECQRAEYRLDFDDVSLDGRSTPKRAGMQTFRRPG